MMRWQVQEAKQRFSEVVRAAEAGEPQIVTRHGEEVVVVVDIEQFHRLQGDTTNLMAYLRRDASTPADLGIERSRETPRDVDLGE
jgi:prevent-host-death family protein